MNLRSNQANFSSEIGEIAENEKNIQNRPNGL
jgi:hypothetical protein